MCGQDGGEEAESNLYLELVFVRDGTRGHVRDKPGLSPWATFPAFSLW